MGFEEEALMDTPNRTVPNINGDFPLFPKQHMNSKCSNTRKIPNFKSSFLSYSNSLLEEIMPSIAFDKQFANNMLTEIKAKNRILDKNEFKELYDYINQIQQDLLKHNPNLNHLDDFDWEIVIEDSMKKNAHSFGYGKIGINKGLFLKVDSKDQLAGIIGHEIAHNAERHNIKIQILKIATTAGLICSIPVVLSSASFSQLVTFCFISTYGLMTFKNCYKRYLETQADLVSCDLLHNSNYEVKQFRDFFKNERIKGNSIFMLLYDITNLRHPSNSKRTENINLFLNNHELTKSEKKTLGELKPSFSEIQKNCITKFKSSSKHKDVNKSVIETEL